MDEDPPGVELPPPLLPERALAIRRATSRLCEMLSWVVLHEVPLPNSRRADILSPLPAGAPCSSVSPRSLRDDWPGWTIPPSPRRSGPHCGRSDTNGAVG